MPTVKRRPNTDPTVPEVHNIHTVRTALGLRDALFDELDNLRSGRSSPRQANSVAHVASEIIKSVFMEIEYHNVMHRLSNGAAEVDVVQPPPAAGTLELGTV